MTTRHNRRAGATLTEVLVSLFVMAAGMTALLTLFPLGALQISQALKDDRTAQTAAQADAQMRMYWRANMVDTRNELVLPFAFGEPENTFPLTYLPAPWVTTNGSPASHPLTGFAPLRPPASGTAVPVIPQDSSAPSYPVLIDPLGVVARSTANQERFWVARSTTGLPAAPTPTFPPLIPRRSLGDCFLLRVPITPTPATPPFDRLERRFSPYDSARAFRNCSMIDDLTYDTNGEVHYDRPNPTPTLPPLAVAQGRYNWAALLQRPENNKPTTARMTILVFDGRPPQLVVPGDETVVNAVPLTVGNRDLTITVPIRNDQPPLIRKGGWIMDGTIGNAPLRIAPPTSPALPRDGVDFLSLRNANFYRIVGVTEQSSTATTVTYVLDLETSIKALRNGATKYSDPGNTNTAITYNAQIYLFSGLSEVFERPPLTADNTVQP